MLLEHSQASFPEDGRHLFPMEALESRVLLTVALLDPLSQPRFVNEIGKPAIMQPTAPGGTHYEISVTQAQQQLGLFDPVSGAPLSTTVWGYNGSYPGATFQVEQGTPITVRWSNNLVDGSGEALPHLLPVDTSVHWAEPEGWPGSGVPLVTHLHGGHTESASDGLPEAWFTPGFEQTGPDFVKETYVYDNDQEAATLWYHDHALGITRLNVYAGLGGFYLLSNTWERSLNLPKGAYDVPLVVQDRMFTADGELFIPSEPEVPGAPEPSVLPEFFGDFILVNGKAWPTMNVEPRKYRFRLLNGSDSRFYNFFLSSGQSFYQIGSDQGLLNKPVKLNRLTLGPGERADVIVDFSTMAGQTIVMRNNAKTPFPGGEAINPRTAGQIMAFKVGTSVTGTDSSVIPSVLRPAPISRPELAPTQTEPTRRQLLLFEGEDEYGRLLPLLGTVEDGALRWDDPITENPRLNDVEIWEIYNTTEDAHPIHLHLVNFQLLGRQKFRATQLENGALTDIRLIGGQKGPAANEAGLKDTVQMFPGQVTRIMMKFDRQGAYVWHCHILSHEDHEMMRPYEVLPALAPTAAAAELADSPRTSAIFSSTPVSAALRSEEEPLLETASTI